MLNFVSILENENYITMIYYYPPTRMANTLEINYPTENFM